MKNIKRYILFWDVILCAAFLLSSFILSLCDLMFRVYIREPITMIIGLSFFAGIFQLLIRLIPKEKKKTKIISIVAWSLLTLLLVGYGFFIFIFEVKSDRGTKTYSDGKSYVEESESALWMTYYRFYEDHGPLVRSKTLAYSTYPYEQYNFSEETAEMFNIY